MLLALISKVTEKYSMVEIFKGTNRYHTNAKEQLPSGLLILLSDKKYELMLDNFMIIQTEDKAEVLALYVATLRVHTQPMPQKAEKILQKLIKF